MPLSQAKVMDLTLGTCYYPDTPPHPVVGLVILGAGTVKTNNQATANFISITVHIGCTHSAVGLPVTVSTKKFVEKQGAWRMTDTVNDIYGMGVVITGSPNSFSG